MPYFDRARVEYMRHLGLLVQEPSDPEFVMRAQSVEYHAPARFDDELEVFVRVARIGRTSLDWEFAAYNVATGDRLVTAQQTLVQVDLARRKPVVVDPRVVEAVSQFEHIWRPHEHGHHQGTLDAIEQVIAAETESDEILRQAVDLLHDRFESYSWVGIYFVEGDELQLGPWKGPHATEHVRIPVGSGVCGAAAASGRTEVVDDVTADDRYLACFPSTRSEIVVPVSYEDMVVAEIDIDSDRPPLSRQTTRISWSASPS